MKDKKENFKIKICELEKKYGFKGMLHFTDYSNLKSIFKEKSLFSRGYCNNNKMNFKDVADKDVINHTNNEVKRYARFYYKEKTPTLYKNEGIKIDNKDPHVPIPVYLLFDSKIIYMDNTIYSDGNAGSKYTKFGQDFEFFNNIDWETVFGRGVISFDLPDIERMEIKRIRHAELLVKESVSLKYLKKIIFRSECDYKRAIDEFGYSNLYEIDKTLFNCENNFVKDYEINYNSKENYINLDIKFNKDNFEEYNLNCGIFNKKGKVLSVIGKCTYKDKINKKICIKLDGYSKEWDRIIFQMNKVNCILAKIKI